MPHEKVPGYLQRAHEEYVNAPEGILGEIWNWLKGIFERLIAAIAGLLGQLAEGVKNWIPGLGGSEAICIYSGTFISNMPDKDLAGIYFFTIITVTI